MNNTFQNLIMLGSIVLIFFFGWKYLVGLLLGTFISAIVFFYPNSYMGMIYNKMFNIKNSLGGEYAKTIKENAEERNKFKVKFKK